MNSTRVEIIGNGRTVARLEMEQSGARVLAGLDCEGHSNARLIAAAPDLLAALKRMAHIPCEMRGNINCTMLPADSGQKVCPFCEARAAIAAATGQEVR